MRPRSRTQHEHSRNVDRRFQIIIDRLGVVWSHSRRIRSGPQDHAACATNVSLSPRYRERENIRAQSDNDRDGEGCSSAGGDDDLTLTELWTSCPRHEGAQRTEETHDRDDAEGRATYEMTTDSRSKRTSGMPTIAVE